jgi:hypothetical protein
MTKGVTVNRARMIKIAALIPKLIFNVFFDILPPGHIDIDPESVTMVAFDPGLSMRDSLVYIHSA